MIRRAHSHVYASRRHLVATLLVVFAPFLFLLLFSRSAHVTTSVLLLDLLASFVRLFLAYVIATGLGWALAVAFYRGRRGAVALPLFDVLQSFPTFAALPLAALLWGPSTRTVILFLVLTVIWPIFFSVIGALKLIQRDWVEAVAVARLSRVDFLRLFLWPVTIPGLVTGSIIGLGEGWEALVATEIIVGARPGLGVFFQTHTQNLSVTAFGILGLLLLIFSINKLLWLPLLEWSHRQMEE